MPKCISCHKAIVAIAGRAHCFYDCIYIYIYIYITGRAMKTMYPPTFPVIATMACNLESNVPPQLLPQWLCGNSCTGTWCTVTHCWYQWTEECSTKPLWWWPGGHIVFMIAYTLYSSCICEIWALCDSVCRGSLMTIYWLNKQFDTFHFTCFCSIPTECIRKFLVLLFSYNPLEIFPHLLHTSANNFSFNYFCFLIYPLICLFLFLCNKERKLHIFVCFFLNFIFFD